VLPRLLILLLPPPWYSTACARVRMDNRRRKRGEEKEGGWVAGEGVKACRFCVRHKLYTGFEWMVPKFLHLCACFHKNYNALWPQQQYFVSGVSGSCVWQLVAALQARGREEREMRGNVKCSENGGIFEKRIIKRQIAAQNYNENTKEVVMKSRFWELIYCEIIIGERIC